MTLDDVGLGVMTQCYHNNGRLIMLEVKCIKFSLDIQNSLGIIMCKFHAFQSKTEGMAASVRIFLEHPSYIDYFLDEFDQIVPLWAKVDTSWGTYFLLRLIRECIKNYCLKLLGVDINVCNFI